ncbi:MAG: menaquinol oxidoreductase [Peptococcaceae bacterium BICA1-8]|nr:MAG: menaquinol oxidoreductase [Peptococcaceae bacterium BICA1-8]
MLEKALIKESKRMFWYWIIFLVVLAGVGFNSYLHQLNQGLTVTGLSRDISWGLYIGQFTFFVGVAASAVMLVLPYYLHNVKEFGRITVVGEFLAVSAVIMCMLFIIVDMGMPMRVLNMFLYPTLNSPMFWDATVLTGYLLLNIFIGWNVLEAENKGVNPPKWVKTLILISIPWAVSIHTVTAFLYAGLPSRHYWLTALIAPKFLASAFATGPALLILICFMLKKFTGFDAGKKAIQKLALIITYAMCISIFMVAVEFFTAFFSQVPGHMVTLQYLFMGAHGHGQFVAIMWVFVVLAVLALVLLIPRKTRENDRTLIIACIAVFVSMFIEKGLTFVIGGLSENPFGEITPYIPGIHEILISIGIWALGIMIASLFYKMVVSVKRESDFANASFNKQEMRDC